MLAEIGIGGVGRTEINGLGIGQCTVATLACAGTGEDANLEGSSCCVFCLGLFGNGSRDALGHTRRCKSAQSNGVSVLYQRGSLDCSNFSEFHKFVLCVISYC